MNTAEPEPERRRDDEELIKVFISSPGELRVERETCERVVNDLNREYRGSAKLDIYKYEKEAQSAHGDFQSQIEDTAKFDIVILVLWSRLGSVMPKIPAYAQHLVAAHPEMTGTECEYYCADSAHQTHGKPTIYAFLKTKTSPVGVTAEARKKWVLEHEALERFILENFNDEKGGSKRALHRFKGSWGNEFNNLLYTQLSSFLEGKFGKRDRVRTRRAYRLFVRTSSTIVLVIIAVLAVAFITKRRELSLSKEAERKQKALIQKALTLTSDASQGGGTALAEMLALELNPADSFEVSLRHAESYFGSRLDRYPFSPEPEVRQQRGNELANFAAFYILFLQRCEQDTLPLCA